MSCFLAGNSGYGNIWLKLGYRREKGTMRLKKAKVLTGVFILIICFPILAGSASYDDVPRKFGGWGVSTTNYFDQVIDGPETIVKLDNIAGNMPKHWERTITRVPGFGTIEGGLASKIQSSVGYNYAYTHRKTDKISISCAPGYRIMELKYVYGDRISVYAKYFVAWVTAKKVNGNIYTPRYFEYVTRSY